MTTFGEELILMVVGENKVTLKVLYMKYNYTTQTVSTDATPSGKSCEMDKTDSNLSMEIDVTTSQESTRVDVLHASKQIVTDIIGDAVEKGIEKAKAFKLTDKSLHNFEYLYTESPKSEESIGSISYPQPLPDVFYTRLPKFYTELPGEQKMRELRDAVLQAQFTVASATLPNCRVWDEFNEYSCNLMSLFASASTMGKSTITETSKTIELIHEMLWDEKLEAEKEYDEAVEKYEENKRKRGNSRGKSANDVTLEKPQKRTVPQIRLAPKTTSPDLYMKLHRQKGLPMHMTQPEMHNTLIANRGEHGKFLDNFTYLWDNAGMHSSIKTNEEEFYIPHPVVSLLATMTDDQLPELLNDVPDGLEARINTRIIYCENDYRPENSDTFTRHQAIMTRLQQNLHDLYFFLRRKDNDEQKYTLVFTPEVKAQMDRYLDSKSRIVDAIYRCKNAKGVVFRRRVDFKRYLLQVTLHRRHEQLGSWGEALSSYQIVPTLEDANLMLFYINHIIDHTLYVLELYGKTKEERQENKKKDLMSILNSLGGTFSSTQAKLALQENGIGERKAYREIKKWEKANLIEETNMMGNERIFRKLTTKEKKQRDKLSAKQSGKRKHTVNKHSKK